MALELIYTSAPSGIKPGTRGFCTVACSRELPTPLAATLESLSGYRHLYPPNSENARLNPVVCSHITFKFNGSPLHLLSRIADAGYDYSQRTNKIAHHLVLPSAELVNAGPAEVFTRSGVFVEKWESEPTVFPTARMIPDFDISSKPCSAWKAMTQDAGWGGLLAYSVMRRQPVGLVFRPGQNIFDLFREAVALLPENKRWEATFSTFYSKMPPGFDCLWKAVLLDSPEEPSVRAVPNSLFLDLTRPLGDIGRFAADLQIASWIEMARTGKRVISNVSEGNTPSPLTQVPHVGMKPAFRPASPPPVSMSDTPSTFPDQYENNPFSGIPATSSSTVQLHLKPMKKKSLFRRLLFCFILFLLLFGIGVVGVIFFVGSDLKNHLDNIKDEANGENTIASSTENNAQTTTPANETADNVDEETKAAEEAARKEEEERKAAEEAARKKEEEKKAAEEAARKEEEERKAAEEAAKKEEERKATETKTCQDFLQKLTNIRLSYATDGESYTDNGNKTPDLIKQYARVKEIFKNNGWSIKLKAIEPVVDIGCVTHLRTEPVIHNKQDDSLRCDVKFQYVDSSSPTPYDNMFALTVILNDHGASFYQVYNVSESDIGNEQIYTNKYYLLNYLLLSNLTWEIADKNDKSIFKKTGQLFQPYGQSELPTKKLDLFELDQKHDLSKLYEMIIDKNSEKPDLPNLENLSYAVRLVSAENKPVTKDKNRPSCYSLNDVYENSVCRIFNGENDFNKSNLSKITFSIFDIHSNSLVSSIEENIKKEHEVEIKQKDEEIKGIEKEINKRKNEKENSPNELEEKLAKVKEDREMIEKVIRDKIDAEKNNIIEKFHHHYLGYQILLINKGDSKKSVVIYDSRL